MLLMYWRESHTKGTVSSVPLLGNCQKKSVQVKTFNFPLSMRKLIVSMPYALKFNAQKSSHGIRLYLKESNHIHIIRAYFERFSLDGTDNYPNQKVEETFCGCIDVGEFSGKGGICRM